MTSRTERQHEGIRKWWNNKGVGTLLYATGFGKTFVACTAIAQLIKKVPSLTTLVIVPTDQLKLQWKARTSHLTNVTVMVINSAMTLKPKADLVILDEVHLYVGDNRLQFIKEMNYRLKLALTGTIERPDGKEKAFLDMCPIVDIVTKEEAIKNGWLNTYTEYKVLIDVDDIEEYRTLNHSFIKCFSYFGYDFNMALKASTDFEFRKYLSRQCKLPLKEITINALGFGKALRKRKEFVYNHPKKVEIVNKIISSRQSSKGIVFAMSTDICLQFNTQYIYHSKLTGKQKKNALEGFTNCCTGFIAAPKALDQGADFPGVNIAIIAAGSSSKIQKNQRSGRAIRFEDGKDVEIFNLVIRGTVDESWAIKSSDSYDYKVINIDGLDKLLKGEKFYCLDEDSEKVDFYRS